MLENRVNHFRSEDHVIESMTVLFRCKDALLKECDVEIRGVHSVDQMMDLVEVHAKEAHPLVKLSPETRKKIRNAIRKD